MGWQTKNGEIFPEGHEDWSGKSHNLIDYTKAVTQRPNDLGFDYSYIIQEEGEKDDRPTLFLYFPLTAPHTPIVPSDQFRGTKGAGAYGDFISQLDFTVGEVMEALKKSEMWENTLFIYSSDNGPSPAISANELVSKGYDSSGGLRGPKPIYTKGVIAFLSSHLDPKLSSPEAAVSKQSA